MTRPVPNALVRRAPLRNECAAAAAITDPHLKRDFMRTILRFHAALQDSPHAGRCLHSINRGPGREKVDG